jgi:hypothetical protein
MTITEIRNKVVATAKRHLGCKEGSAEHHAIIDLFNTVKPDGWKMTYSAAWCAAFATEVLIEALGAADAKKVAPMSANCDNMIRHAKEMGCWVENDAYKPKKGEMVLYDWQDTGYGDDKGGADHVGIVEKVSGNTITVIEGNYSDMVKRRTLQVNGRYIRGYVTPLYSKIATKKPKTKPQKTVLEIAKEVIDGKWSNGDERKKLLKAAGYDYNAVQKKVNELLAQKDYVYTRTSANVRSGPGMSYDKILHLDKNTKVERLKTVGRWTKVKAKSKVGYIWSGRLK